MSYSSKARCATTVEEASEAIRSFMLETIEHPDPRAFGRSHDYDLYLPWFNEVVENLPMAEGQVPTPTPTLERLYMEAAWKLVMQGFLRPGPHKVVNDNARDAYGKGFSLTFSGEDWLGAKSRS